MTDISRVKTFLDDAPFTNLSVDELAHFGVLGMKWGVRKEKTDAESRAKNIKQGHDIVYNKKLKNGGSLIVTKKPPAKGTRFGAWLATKYPDIFLDLDDVHEFTLRDAKGKSVGSASFVSKKDDSSSLYLDWITVDKKHRGQGYATATMKAMIKYSQDNNVSTLKLEVPGNAPDAQHIYSNLGFNVTGKTTGSDFDYWGGLTEMELKVPQTQMSHSIVNLETLFDYMVEFIDDANLDDQGNAQLAHTEGGIMTDLTRAKTFVNKLPIVQMRPDELAHFGVLGMKWGVRNDNGHVGERARTKKIVKLDKKFAANAQTVKTTFALHNAAAQKTNDLDVDRINSKPQYKNADFTRDTPLRRKYYKEHQDAFINRLQEAADSYGTNASGTAKYSIIETPSGGWDVFLKEVKHSDDAEPLFKVVVTYNTSGYITKLSPDELAHYGVLGMRWGHSKYGSSGRAGNRRAKKVRQIHPDHAETHSLAKKHISSLSTQELQRINSRLQAEKKYKDLNPDAIKRGKDAYKALIGIGAASTAIALLFQTPAGKLAVKSGKRIVDNLLQGSGKHVLRTVMKTAKHLP